VSDQLAGALHYIDDEAGDAYRFCVALADAAQRQGVRFHYGVEVSRLKMNGDRVVSVVSNQGEFTADQYIVAAGSHSTALLAQAGVRLPVRPAKGYSVTIDDISREGSLGIPILDDDWHAAIVPLSGAMRIAGTAEFAGNDRTMDPARIANLLRLLRQVLPQLQFDSGTMKPWCGLRPMSADGVPIIGRTRVENLFVNTGHGPLGWTMSAGSAKLLADMLTGDQPSLDPSPYSLSRY
jgi:D-amino-acid dehydrogenase